MSYAVDIFSLIFIPLNYSSKVDFLVKLHCELILQNSKRPFFQNISQKFTKTVSSDVKSSVLVKFSSFSEPLLPMRQIF